MAACNDGAGDEDDLQELLSSADDAGLPDVSSDFCPIMLSMVKPEPRGDFSGRVLVVVAVNLGDDCCC